MIELYELLSDSQVVEQYRLQFVNSSQYIRREGDSAKTAVLLDDDANFSFDVHVYAAVSLTEPGREKVQLYTFSCGGRTLCVSPDDRQSSDGYELKFQELGSQETRDTRIVTTNDVSYFIGVQVNDCKAFESVFCLGRDIVYDEHDKPCSYYVYDDEGQVTLKKTSSTETKTHLRLE